MGCTGWRLGVIALHEDNIIDKMIAGLPAPERQITDQRYEKIALEPAGIKFIDRLVADSRDVALNHTAGLSLPQQAQMQLFSLFQLMDEDNRYQESVMKIVAHGLRSSPRTWGSRSGSGRIMPLTMASSTSNPGCVNTLMRG